MKILIDENLPRKLVATLRAEGYEVESVHTLHLQGLEWRYLEKHATSLLLGSSILGFLAAVIAYFACYYLVVKFRSRDEGQAVLVKEMEQVGEELE